MKHPWRITNRESESTESFEVLLQLLFPITLILAFVVITELAALQNTSAGVAEAQRHEAVISLQEQLLLKATRELFEKESERLQLSRYEALMPTPEQVLDCNLPPDFVVATKNLFESFGTHTLRTRKELRMRLQSSRYYKDVLREYAATHPNLGANSLTELANITSDNQTKLTKAVAGEMENLAQKAAAPQLGLIVKWIQNERATRESGEKIARAWQAFVSAQAADKKNMSDRFVNLKVLALQERLLGLRAPLQEDVVHEVL